MNPLIVAAEVDESTQETFDRLRRTHFPPERNRLAAHVTLFHALPGDALGDVLDAVRRACARPAPTAEVTGVRSLGRGAALVVASPGLSAARSAVAGDFTGRLTRQDAHGFSPHVTVQNFVEPAVARATVERLTAEVAPWGFTVTGLSVHRYAGGPWDHVETVPFD
ncbi:2'-5' RNA ligase family protein [Kineococcus sp. TBRC 1896]|uniref:2'-5' RNA ligase family protein n=1 Tax=Kineococcus mangrovi TaxID=1660183 RepID=A0ABV4HZR6_9ACTN